MVRLNRLLKRCLVFVLYRCVVSAHRCYISITDIVIDVSKLFVCCLNKQTMLADYYPPELGAFLAVSQHF